MGTPVVGERGRMSLMREFVSVVNAQVDERSAEIGERDVLRELRSRKSKLAKDAHTATRYANLLSVVRDRMVEDVKRR